MALPNNLHDRDTGIFFTEAHFCFEHLSAPAEICASPPPADREYRLDAAMHSRGRRVGRLVCVVRLCTWCRRFDDLPLYLSETPGVAGERPGVTGPRLEGVPALTRATGYTGVAARS